MAALHLIRGIALQLFLIVFSMVLVKFVLQIGLFSGEAVFFYRGLKVILVTISAISLLLLAVPFNWIDRKDVLVSFSMMLCVNTLFFTHLPVTADRSVTVFLLGYMSDAKKSAYSKDELESALIEKYIREFKAVDRRMDEQIRTGTVSATNGEYSLTPQGKSLTNLYSKIVEWYEIPDDYVHPLHKKMPRSGEPSSSK
ncbi:hypothetical protein [Chitiniphilus eburneus]|uniref:Uncharacterized protein n=1 Tax=Chitiniphilus eburneus TaxID=2571148 RepID=A0A4U0QAF8_9NEIS|nr:hypothetical protein [Chitiniphilus eburneus]TJZ77402.1 hypothetical protein FAZ21_03430 [Chitiniphilus eburneus]